MNMTNGQFDSLYAVFDRLLVQTHDEHKEIKKSS